MSGLIHVKHQGSPKESDATPGNDCAVGGTTPREIQIVPITVVIPTLQEELNLGACLASVAGWVERIVIVDSGSNDGTLSIAAEYGAQILTHPFDTHARQWRWTIEFLRQDVTMRADRWVLGLDADQRVSPELRDELLTLFSSPSQSGKRTATAGFYIKRRQVFRGQWIRRGGYYPKYLLKLFRLNVVQFDDADLVDHHFYVDGKVTTLKNDLIEENHKENDIFFWVEKHCRYAAKLAEEEHGRYSLGGHRSSPLSAAAFGSHDQRTLWLKRCWSKLPLFVRPFLYFLYRYVCRLGFLDGKQGLIFHFLHACWFRFLVDVYLDQLENGQRSLGRRNH